MLGTVTLLAGCESSVENAMERELEEETGGDAEVDLNEDGGMRIESEEGTFTTGNKMPEDWPSDVPVYAGAEVQYTATSNPVTGQAGTVLVLLSTDTQDEVVDFYKGALVGAGWVIEGSMKSGEMVVMGASKGNRQVSVMIAGVEGGTNITLGVAQKE